MSTFENWRPLFWIKRLLSKSCFFVVFFIVFNIFLKILNIVLLACLRCLLIHLDMYFFFKEFSGWWCQPVRNQSIFYKKKPKSDGLTPWGGKSVTLSFKTFLGPKCWFSQEKAKPTFRPHRWTQFVQKKTYPYVHILKSYSSFPGKKWRTYPLLRYWINWVN